VATSVLPSVAHIQVRSNVTFGGDEEAGRPGTRRSFPRASATGWVWSPEGFIVTNAHVAEGSDELRVELNDGRVRNARVVGTDVRTDIALLKIDDAPGLVPLRRASGEPVFVGDRVFAFGSPFGIKFSMSQGIVSGLGRSEAAGLVGMNSGYTNFIQTDAAINPGNSGGPLVDVRGRIVGMSTAIANNVQFDGDGPALQGQSAGIGFAIPLETIEAIVGQLVEDNIVLRGYLGITLSQYFPEIAQRFNLTYDGTGIVVTAVRDGHPAERAGLRVGDVITRVQGSVASNPDVLRSLVSIRQPGESVKIGLWREGQASELEVRVGAAYFSADREGREDLVYVPGSENMTKAQVRQEVENRAPDRID